MQPLAYETMATKSNLVNYKSIRKPSYGGGGSSRLSTYINSLTKKQNAAEDAILDNQYDEGIITPENYLNALKTRLGRDYLTPLQIVNLQDKMVQVGEKVNDASVDRQYKAGDITTSQVYSYEKEKLDKMTATDSPTYNSQSTKVQQLKDKAEKETRAEYRLQENVRISKLPEDSSANLWAKAKLYENLQNQATIDGDTSQAMAYEATKNNYISGAKRGDINDIITGAKNTVSSMTEGEMGVPDAGAGQTYYNQLIGQNEPVSSAVSGGGTTQAPTTVASSIGVEAGAVSSYGNSPAVKNAMESLDRGQKTIDRLYADLKQKQFLLGKYDEAISKASGDQKTQLLTARNNLADTINQTNNSIGIAEQGIQDTVTRIQELEQKAATSAFSQEVRKNNMSFDQKETQIETEFSKGKITKQEYIQLAAGLAESKSNYLGEVSNVFNQYGNDISAETYMQKAGDMQTIAQNLNDVGTNIDDYEPIAVDPKGKISNIFGKALRPGEFALTNVRQEKDAGTFDMNYVNRGGGYFKVYFPNTKDEMGLPVSASLAKEMGKLNDQSFIYTTKGGKQVTEQITFVTFTDESGNPTTVKPMVSSMVETLKKKGIIAPSLGKNSDTNFMVNESQLQINPDGSVNFSIPPPPAPGAADKIYKKVTGTLDYMGKNMPKVGKTVIDSKTGQKVWIPFSGFAPGFLETPIKKGQELLKNVGTGISDFLGGKYGVTERIGGRDIYMPFKKKPEGQSVTPPFDFVTQAIQKMFPQVQAAEINKNAPAIQNKLVQGQVDKVISALPENERNAATLVAKALKKQGILDPNTLAYAMATMKHETAGSFQPVNEGYYNDEKYGYEPGFTGRNEARKRGYDGGEDYYGRGYIQLTGLGNYKTYGDALGIDLVNNPDLANDPEIAAKIMALYMKNRGTANLATSGHFVDARGTINQDDKGQYIAGITQQYLKNAPLLKSLISSVNAQEKKPVGKTSLKLRYEDPKPKSLLQKIGQRISDFFVKPVGASTVPKVTAPKSFIPTISTNAGVKTFTSSTNNKSQQNKSNQSSQQNKSTQSFTPQISTNQGVKTYTPTPTYQTKAPAYSAPKPTPVPTPKPAPQYQTPAPRYTPAPAPKQNIVQKAISGIRNFINKWKWW